MKSFDKAVQWTPKKHYETAIKLGRLAEEADYNPALQDYFVSMAQLHAALSVAAACIPTEYTEVEEP